MRLFLLAAALVLYPSMAAATLQPADFAYGMALSLEENGAVYRFSVPREVYETLARDDMGDIRIFNSKDAVVPHILRQPEKKRKIQEFTHPLPFFPLYREKNKPENDGLLVRIEKGGDGAIINVESDAARTGKPPELSGYLIDATGHEKQIHKLHINWQAKEENFVTTVSVEYSNDLTRWSPLVPRATLVQMQFSGHEITQKRLQLPPGTAQYLRLSWPAGRDGIEVKEILAVEQTGKPERKREWTPLKGTPGPDDNNKQITAYEYHSPGRLPVDRVRFRFAEKNTLVKATLFSRPDPEATWRHRQRGIFYDLSFDHTTLVLDTISLDQSSDRFWRVELEGIPSGDPGDIPVIELGWQPHELLFVARGKGPFMLAYGSARLGREELNSSPAGLLAQVMGRDGDALLKEAALLPKNVLGGPDLLVPEPPPLPWKKWLLWGVLVAGVGIIARMALSLGKGMNKES
ncbi:MAG: DUF3999 domain-containing protein [Desulfobacteraceae bacterium]|nr:DUF3999 domain-containing protein [Desulfobacteraceae bacterium]